MGNQPSRTDKPRVTIEAAERAGESQVYRSYHLKKGEELLSFTNENVRTLYDAFNVTAEKFPKNNYLGWRVESNYEWISYGDVAIRSKNVGAGLLSLGLKPSDRIGLASINRTEWNLTEHAVNAYSLTLVPLYDTLGVEALLHIIKECNLEIIVCSTERVKTLLDVAKEVSLKIIVSFSPPSEEQQVLAEKVGVKIIAFEEIEKIGKENPQDIVPPKPDDISTICYTSGTTGLPKGVILTHKGIVAAAVGLTYGEVEVTDKDIHISYLPSAHVFERVISTVVVLFGASMGYYSGDARKLFEDISILKPTIFVTVPRLLGRLYDKVMEAVNVGGITQPLFETAYQAKVDNLRQGYLTHAVYDNLVFSKVKTKLGGNVRFIITGSAPLAANLMDFLRVCFCCPVLEGYGQTETCCGGTRTLLWDTDTGHVGVPTPSIDVKLVSVPSMKYDAEAEIPRGEICFRGPTCTPGYFCNPEKTKEIIDEHGWLHSGDVGMFLPNGNLRIIDRVKNIFKLSQGEYVAPEKIEQIFNQSKYVAQSFVYGESLKSAVIAVIVPDQEVLLKWAEETKHPDKADFAALCANKDVNKMIFEDLLAIGKKQDLKGFELPRTIHLSPSLMTVDNDMMTPTFKLKRPQVTAYYKEQLSAMYVGID